MIIMMMIHDVLARKSTHVQPSSANQVCKMKDWLSKSTTWFRPVTEYQLIKLPTSYHQSLVTS